MKEKFLSFFTEKREEYIDKLINENKGKTNKTIPLVKPRVN